MSPDGKAELGLIQFVLTPERTVAARYWMERSEFDRINQEAAQKTAASAESQAPTETPIQQVSEQEILLSQ